MSAQEEAKSLSMKSGIFCIWDSRHVPHMFPKVTTLRVAINAYHIYAVSCINHDSEYGNPNSDRQGQQRIAMAQMEESR